MIWVRKVFGFILLAMAVYFLEPLFPNPLAYRLTFALILLLAGIYLAWIDRVESTGKAFPLVRNIVGILFFALALYAAVTGIENFLRNASTGTGRIQGHKRDPVVSLFTRRCWIRPRAKASRFSSISMPTGACPARKWMRRHLPTPEVVTRSRDFVMLKVDLTSTEDPKAGALREKYQVKGVPTLVFLQPDGQEISDLRGTGFESKDVFLEKMNKALEMSRKQSSSMIAAQWVGASAPMWHN